MPMSHPHVPGFENPELGAILTQLTDADLDALPYGVIGFDAQNRITHYNQHEASMAYFDKAKVLGQDLFIELAPCLNNYLVAGRYEEALAQGEALDETMPYVLTFRMRPTHVHMRLLSITKHPTRYLIIQRSGVRSAP
jgi:photoactive yellow protein